MCIYGDDQKKLEYMKNAKRIEEFEVYYYAIEELYFSQYRVYLNKLKYGVLATKYLATQKYLGEKKYTMLDFINYYIKILEYEAEKELKYAN